MNIFYIDLNLYLTKKHLYEINHNFTRKSSFFTYFVLLLGMFCFKIECYSIVQYNHEYIFTKNARIIDVPLWLLISTHCENKISDKSKQILFTTISSSHA